jgi:hypothetical protein
MSARMGGGGWWRRRRRRRNQAYNNGFVRPKLAFLYDTPILYAPNNHVYVASFSID